MLNITYLVNISPMRTIELIDMRFEADHSWLIDSLSHEKQTQMIYIEAFMSEKEQLIADTIKQYGVGVESGGAAKNYLSLLKLMLKLMCELKPERVLPLIEKIVEESHYPINEYLIICEEHKMRESCALLNRKIGHYYLSVC